MTVPLLEHTVMRGQLVLLGAERVLSLFASLFGLSSCRNSVAVSLQLFVSFLSRTRLRKVTIPSRSWSRCASLKENRHLAPPHINYSSSVGQNTCSC